MLVGMLGLSCSTPPVARTVRSGPPPPAPRECVELARDPAVEPAVPSSEPAEAPLTEPLAVYEARVTQHPTEAAAYFDLVRKYEEAEAWGRAASTALRLLQFEPHNPRYLHRRGLNLVREAEAGEANRFADARAPLQECIVVAPDFADCHFLLGEVALWTDDEPLAEQRYRRAIELAPRRADYHLRLAELYRAYRQDHAAATVLSDALRFVPVQGQFPLLISLADLSAKRGDPARALGYLERAEPLAVSGSASLSYELARSRPAWRSGSGAGSRCGSRS